jgi:tetratricopeptide (TPR) repeat protein
MTAQLQASKRFFSAISTALVAVSLSGNIALAGDPFRKSNPQNIGTDTEMAFVLMFKGGNYKEAKNYLIKADGTEASEPLAHAMRASIAYTEEDWENVKLYADKTIETAEQLQTQNPLRGNLYLAVGHFLEGAYIYSQQKDPVSAMTKLQQVFQYLDTAEGIAPDDPELNLIKGYLDLIVSVNLPFSSPEDAIARFEKYASPDYLVDRGIAVAYRDLREYDKALSFAERALNAAPENPEILYLKGQILRKLGKNHHDLTKMKQAFSYFDLALKKQNQLPESLLVSLRHEHKVIQEEIQTF